MQTLPNLDPPPSKTQLPGQFPGPVHLCSITHIPVVGPQQVPFHLPRPILREGSREPPGSQDTHTRTHACTHTLSWAPAINWCPGYCSQGGPWPSFPRRMLMEHPLCARPCVCTLYHPIQPRGFLSELEQKSQLSPQPRSVSLQICPPPLLPSF